MEARRQTSLFILPKPEGTGLAVQLETYTCGPHSTETDYMDEGNLKTRVSFPLAQIHTINSSLAERLWLPDNNIWA